MLTIPFSHVYKKMPLNIDKPWAKTVLLGYRVANTLSPAFLQYDTTIIGGGNFKLPAKGPYLVLSLKTTFYGIEGLELGRKCWTTVRCPWRRLKKACFNCGHEKCPGGHWQDKFTPCCWNPIIPAKYREARGKEVRIVIEERGDNVAGR